MEVALRRGSDVPNHWRFFCHHLRSLLLFVPSCNNVYKKKEAAFLVSYIAFFCICFIYLDCLYLLFGPASCCCFSVAQTIVGTWPFFFSIGAEGGRRKGRLGAGRRAPIDGGAVGSSGLGAVVVTPHVELHGAPAESP